MPSTSSHGSVHRLVGNAVFSLSEQLAVQAGWSTVPGYGVSCSTDVGLKLGPQVIPVWRLEPAVDITERALSLLSELGSTMWLEHFLILDGLPPEEHARIRALFIDGMSRKVWVGTPAEYLSWLPARLGALSELMQDSPVRRLVEHMVCLTGSAPPVEKVPVAGDYGRSSIVAAFTQGQRGVQAIETLFSHTRGRHNVTNVEEDKVWQGKDVDLLVLDSTGCEQLKVEIKTERHTSGNITLEEYGNFERKSVGWLHYSAADVLVSYLESTGDVLLVGMEDARQWVARNKSNIPQRRGHDPKQPYTSLVWLGAMQRMLTELPSVYLRLDEWMPALYPEFKHPSLVPARLGHRKLLPH